MLMKILKKQSGMTFSSVLIASLIISMISFSLLTAITGSKNRYIFSSDKLIATRLAESEMEKAVYKLKFQGITEDTVENIDKYNINTIYSQQTDTLYKITVNIEFTSIISKNKEYFRTVSIDRLVVR